MRDLLCLGVQRAFLKEEEGRLLKAPAVFFELFGRREICFWDQLWCLFAAVDQGGKGLEALRELLDRLKEKKAALEREKEKDHPKDATTRTTKESESLRRDLEIYQAYNRIKKEKPDANSHLTEAERLRISQIRSQEAELREEQSAAYAADDLRGARKLEAQLTSLREERRDIEDLGYERESLAEHQFRPYHVDRRKDLDSNLKELGPRIPGTGTGGAREGGPLGILDARRQEGNGEEEEKMGDQGVSADSGPPEEARQRENSVPDSEKGKAAADSSKAGESSEGSQSDVDWPTPQVWAFRRQRKLPTDAEIDRVLNRYS
uniref:Uncharacterized protein n=1 Tax=Chromera velia CCMP2878 TaxID=1169474 RepID=A0A0G4IDP1_9ALVE|eukprot:Cvel_13349.t1-p1 / transcript=Cvel_13349.t1 / gene=Cvel_13349 / organism=Chromera_velia_CCMP2878 / gene_product=hypothetical protein / transcript_product=hypothetical protein / location=Cvel_scaffold907:8583-10832(-) / protein_length=319 / sequence_SO=supercontig / SO=protein_coding / is_pseudo=false